MISVSGSPRPESPSAASAPTALVERAFAAHFPAWDRMSPFDPVKLVAEGLAGSLAAVEARQRRMLESALDAMPALFGFAPKPARLPVALFRVRAPERATAVASLVGRSMRLRSKSETLALFPDADAEVAPVTPLVSERRGGELRLSTTTRGPLAELSLTFVPGESPVAVRRLELRVEADGAEPVTEKGLVVTDTTDGLTAFGTLRFRRRDGRPVATGAGAVAVVLLTDVAPAGAFRTDVVRLAFGRRCEDASIGFLDGEAWESKPLPATLVGAPRSVVLRFPDGRRRELAAIPEEALRSAVETPEAFREGYLYDGVQHRLVLPAADLLVGEWNGGVEVLLSEALELPAGSGIPVEAEAQLGDASSVLESLEAESLLAAALPRESAAAFLARFYGAMRRLPERKGGTDVRPADWALLLEDRLARVRQAEVVATGDTARAFLLCEDPSGADAFRLDAALVAQAKRQLEAELPLRMSAELRPFVPVNVTVEAVATATVSDAALASLAPSALQAAVDAAVRESLLPPPFGDAVAGSHRSQAELEAVVGGKASRALGAAVGVRLVLRDSSGAFVERWERRAGECPVPTVRVTAEIRVRGGER